MAAMLTWLQLKYEGYVNMDCHLAYINDTCCFISRSKNIKQLSCIVASITHYCSHQFLLSCVVCIPLCKAGDDSTRVDLSLLGFNNSTLPGDHSLFTEFLATLRICWVVIEKLPYMYYTRSGQVWHAARITDITICVGNHHLVPHLRAILFITEL